jgi:PAS domain S-box-containing protein
VYRFAVNVYGLPAIAGMTPVQAGLQKMVLLANETTFWHTTCEHECRQGRFMRLWFKNRQADGDAQAAEDMAPAIKSQPHVEVKPGEREAPAFGSGSASAAERPVPLGAPAAPAAAPSVPSAQKATGFNGAGAAAYKSDHRSLYKQLLGGLYDAVLITDPKGHVIDINTRVTNFFNFTREETWDLPISTLIPGVNTALISRIRQGLSGERFVLIDGQCVRKDRSTFAAEIAISSIDLVNDGDLVFSIRNVERRSAQMQKLKSCQNLLNHVPTAAAACDSEARIKVANAALARLLGYARADELGDKPFTVVWKEAGSTDAIKRVLAGELWKETVQVVKASGARIQLTLSLAPELNVRKKAIGFLAAFSPASVVTLAGSSAKEG